MDLKYFISKNQLSVIRSNCKGEEGGYFKAIIEDLEAKISTMPKTYETDVQGDDAIATLHYFLGSSDWYIVERDQEEDQFQAFGFTCLNGDRQNAEFGYINIEELIQSGVELDLYYKPETIGTIKARFT